MKNKNILNILIVLVVLGGAIWYTASHKPVVLAPEDTNRVGSPTTSPDGKIKADVFSGVLEEVNTGCFADGECYVVVGGKHVTAIMGWSQAIGGTIIGVEGFGDLESHIGEQVEVYAQVNPDGTYTLYGSEGFYIKLK
ncbi:MAG: hypothetical protein KBC06_01815 [Candidatus Pacebacteria bacterium]|nr:hypothetical protein [Candidatus Paceibacterota bacterium]